MTTLLGVMTGFGDLFSNTSSSELELDGSIDWVMVV